TLVNDLDLAFVYYHSRVSSAAPMRARDVSLCPRPRGSKRPDRRKVIRNLLDFRTTIIFSNAGDDRGGKGGRKMKPTLHLAEERSAKNISIDDVATSTRINPQYLRAIDAEDFAQLPAGIYAVSYIR